jgi:hypothetical protein
MSAPPDDPGIPRWDEVPMQEAQTTVSGTVVDRRRGVALESTLVQLECPWLTAPMEAFTNEEGAFTFTLARDGRCTARAVGESSDAQQPVDVVVGADAQVALELDPRARTRGVGTGTARDEMMIKAGVATMAVGAILWVGSVLSLVLIPCGRDGSKGTDCSADARTQLAIGFGTAGTVSLGAGIALTAIGARRKKAIRGGLSVSRHGAGLRLSVSF